jgi:uncharacterized RDD family membrane protein YckC
MTDASQPGAPQPPPSPPPGGWPPPEQATVNWQAPPPDPGPAPGINFAPHGTRFVAYIFDGCLVSFFLLALLIAGSVVLALLAATGSDLARAVAGSLAIIGLLALLVVSLGYFPYFWSNGGQTPGMRPFNLYVVRDADGGPVPMGQSILRLLGMWVGAAVFYLGFIWVFIDARRRGWHDLIAGTCVIERRR